MSLACLDGWLTPAEMAGLPGLPTTDRQIRTIAARENWQCRKRKQRGGGNEYHYSNLPAEAQAALLLQQGEALAEEPKAAEKNQVTYDAESLWRWAESRPQKLRDEGSYKANLLRQAMRLRDNGHKLMAALKLVAEANNAKPSNLKNWYYGVNGKPGAKDYERKDWDVALIPGYAGRTATAECSVEAWEFFKAHHLTRRQPSVASSYRRMQEAAEAHKWTIPSLATIERRLNKEVSRPTQVFLREGAEALRHLLPWQRRDKTVFAPGEAVSGDGLKFDMLWIDWGDEILNTTTAWVWQDIYSGKILAHRVAKTENTDLFRLATYDLTATCLPSYVQIDNTRVAANKIMTAGAKGRKRFKDQPDDALGLLLQLDMEPHFTNPDHTQSSPGAKPVERAFGIGGIHSEVASHPKLLERGYSKAKAIGIDEFREILAEEVKRHNARLGRRTQVCNGVKSFDQAFNEAFAKATVRQATEAQRRLLLLVPEVVTASRAKGEINLNAGKSALGKPRYWDEALAEYAGTKLVAYYDPENLSQDLAVYTLDGRFVCEASRQGDVGFNDTVAAREHAKENKRRMNAMKQAAKAEARMTALEMANQYPEAEDVETPPPGVVQGNFGQKRKVEDGKVIDNTRPVQADDEMEQNLSAAIHQLAAYKQDDEDELEDGLSLLSGAFKKT